VFFFSFLVVWEILRVDCARQFLIGFINDIEKPMPVIYCRGKSVRDAFSYRKLQVDNVIVTRREALVR